MKKSAFFDRKIVVKKMSKNHFFKKIQKKLKMSQKAHVFFKKNQHLDFMIKNDHHFYVIFDPKKVSKISQKQCFLTILEIYSFFVIFNKIRLHPLRVFKSAQNVKK